MGAQVETTETECTGSQHLGRSSECSGSGRGIFVKHAMSAASSSAGDAAPAASTGHAPAAVSETPGAPSAAEALSKATAMSKGDGVVEKTTSITADIQALKEEQQRIREQRKRVTNDLRNAQKRRRRLKSRARQLTNDDLLAVLMMRKDASEAEAAEVDASKVQPTGSGDPPVDTE